MQLQECSVLSIIIGTQSELLGNNWAYLSYPIEENTLECRHICAMSHSF